MSNTLRALAVIAALGAAACAAISQQKAQTAVADNLDFHNLQIFPPNIPHDELITTMRGIARSLGTKCNHCHVANPPGSQEEFNYASDAKPEKKVARTMLRMVRTINTDYISKVNAHGETVTCFTCHRGRTVPETPAPTAETPQPSQPSS